jgi:hypothetical protein
VESIRRTDGRDCDEAVRLVNLLENVFEATIVFLHNGILGGHELRARSEVKIQSSSIKENLPDSFSWR